MSEIEATLTRIKSHLGVKGHWIVGANDKVERNHYNPHNDTKEGKEEEGSRIVATVLEITKKAQILVRDIDPSVRARDQNELIFMRIKSKNDEIMVAPHKDFKIITLQTLTNPDKKDAHKN